MRPLLTCLALLLPVLAFGADADEAALWKALRDGGHVALMRHAIAPGVGDPAGFRLDDCTTQRKLSAQGRAQARAIGERFRANGITTAAVFSSQWCRCLDTARELALCEFAEKLTLSPAKMTREDCEALRAFGLDNHGILDAVEVVSYFNYINRVADALGIDPEPEMLR